MRAKMQEALAILEDVGIHAEVGNMSYEDQRATVKVEISVIREGGEVVTKEQADYDSYKELHDLPERGTQFTRQGITYTITGFKPRSRKYPVIGTAPDGKRFKFAMNVVRPERPSVRAMRLSEGMQESQR